MGAQLHARLRRAWPSLAVACAAWLSLPGAHAQQDWRAAWQAPHGDALPSSSLQQSTLLYIEDNNANMKLVERLIARRSDLRLLTAADGTTGIELARSCQPDVILMDINLPGISGIEALKILREDPATAHILVIALSANAMLRDIELGLEVGFFRYLTKPIIVKEFMDTLDVALEFAKQSSLDKQTT